MRRGLLYGSDGSDDGSTATATKDKAELAEYFCQYNAELVARLLATPGVSGLHVMPITPSAKRMALEHATGWGNASR